MSRVRFEWDATKDSANQAKHGVSFAEAQYAFEDVRRVIRRMSLIAPKRKGDICASANAVDVM
jgi:uncharacterized protein